MGLRKWIDSVLGSTSKFPDASVLNKLNSGVTVDTTLTPPPSPSISKAMVGTVTVPSVSSSGYSYTMGSITSSTGYTFPSMNINSMNISGVQMPPTSYAVGSVSSGTLITFYDNVGNWIVKLERTGEVVWANGDENISGAAKAFSSMLSLAAEQKAGITQAMKTKVRDHIFEEVIRMAQERGPLSADDLTFMLESSKIIEKLKGINE